MSLWAPGGSQMASPAAQEKQRGLASRTTARPSVFSLRATAVRPVSGGRYARGRGELLVAEEAVVFAPSGRSSGVQGVGEFTHTEPSIVITTARLSPPWSSTCLLLRTKDSWAQVRCSALARRKLVRALRESDVLVQEQASWRRPRLPLR